MISIYQAAEIFQQHADEILCVLNETPEEGYKVVAEVDDGGTWWGAKAVDEDAYSAMVRNGEGYAIYFYPQHDKTYFDVLRAIDEWLKWLRKEMFLEETVWGEGDTTK